jgi:hypothetical protein
MRIFIPLSVEISTESTDEPSSISMSFFTYRRSIMTQGRRAEGRKGKTGQTCPLPRCPLALRQFDQLSRKLRQQLRTSRGEMHIVFNAHSAEFREVNARLDGYHCSLRQLSLRDAR